MPRFRGSVRSMFLVARVSLLFLFFTLLYIFHILDNSSYLLFPSISRKERREEKLASSKARLIQVRDRALGVPFYGPLRSRTIISICAHQLQREFGVYPSARQSHFDHSPRQCLPRIYLYAHRNGPFYSKTLLSKTLPSPFLISRQRRIEFKKI